jgi:glucuronoarabinoxylan endo-1,4-beta-xylanase
MLKSRIFCLCTLVISLSVVSASAITITIDHTVKYQTMVGLGGAIDNNSSFAGFANDLVNDVGVSVVRFDPCQAWDLLPQMVTSGCHTIIGSCLSPPANMKDNNSAVNGGHLLATQYDAFATWAVQQIQKFKTQYGFEMYAFSPQNEPEFAEFYPSCIYNGADLVQVTKLIGQKIKAAGLKTKIYMPEDMYAWRTASTYTRYFQPLFADTAAQHAVDYLAFHGYGSNGVSPVQMNVTGLTGWYQFANSHGWGLWNSEEAGAYSMQYAYDCISCLRYGKISCFMKYGMVSTTVGMIGDPNEFLIMQGQKTGTYQICKCIMKFIRPGAIQLRSIPSDSSTFCEFMTFFDPTAHALVVTLATAATPQSITLAGTNLPATFQKWTASLTQACANQGDVASTSTISVPANTVMTLYGTGYNLPTGVSKPMMERSIVQRYIATGERAYDISGRQLSDVHKNPGHVVMIIREGQSRISRQ